MSYGEWEDIMIIEAFVLVLVVKTSIGELALVQ